MNRKLITTFSLLIFFLMWGVVGFIGAKPRSEAALQATALPEQTSVIAPEVTPNAAIPVTGQTQPGARILFVYILFGLGALFLILALLNAANKQTVLYAHRKEPHDEQ